MARLARALGLTLAGLVAVLGCTALVLSVSPKARHALARIGLRQVDGLIAGRVAVGDVHTLTPWHVRLTGVEVRDASGTRVGSLEELEVRLQPWALLDGTLHLTELRARGLSVQLGPLRTADAGLLGALTPTTESGPEEGDELLPFELRIDSLGIREASADAQLEGRLAHADLPRLQAQVRLGEQPQLHVESLELHVRQGERQLLSLHSRAARWSPSAGGRAELSGQLLGHPLSLRLRAGETLDGSSVRARLRGGGGQVRLDLRWKHEALHARVEAHDVQLHGLSAALPELHVDGRLEAHSRKPFTAPFPTTLQWSALALDGRSIPDGSTKLRYQTGRLEVRELALLDGALRGEGRLEVDTLAGEASLHGEGIPLDALPAMGSMRGEVDLELSATRQPGEAARVEGSVALRSLGAPGVQLGAARISVRASARPGSTVHGKLNGSFQKLRARGVQVAEGTLGGEIDGEIGAPRGQLWLETSHARLGQLDPLELSLTVQGDLQRVDAELRARASSARRLQLRATVERRDQGLDLSAQGVAHLQGQRWSLRARGVRLNLQPRPGVRVASLTLQAGDQRLRLEGHYRARSLHAELSTRNLDLARLPFADAHLPPLDGRLQRATLRATGHPDAPDLALEATLAGLSVNDSAAIDGQLSAHLDLGSRAAEADMALREREGEGVAEAHLHSEWSRQRGWPSQATLQNARHELELRVRCIDLSLLRPHLPVSVPGLVGQAGAQLALSGSLDALEGEGWLGLTLRATPGAQAQRLRLGLQLEQDQVDANLIARNGWDPLLEASAHWPEPVQGLVRRAARPEGLIERDFEAHVTLREQRLDRLGGSFGQWLGLMALELPVRATADLKLRGERDRLEGEGSAHVVLFNRAVDERCALKAASDLRATLSLRQERLTGRVDARTHQSGTLGADLEVPFDLRAFVRDRSGVGAAELSARAEDVALHQLPGLCGLNAGRGSMEVELDALGSGRPRLRADVELDAVQLRNEPATSLEAKLRGDSRRLKLEGTARVDGENAGRFEAEIPLRESAGPVPTLAMDAPLSASLEFRELPPASLLSSVDAVGRVDGSLSGELSLSGSLRAPRPEGFLELHELSFSIAQIAQPLQRIDGTIRVDGRRLKLEDIEVHDRQGTAWVDGEAHYDESGEAQADVRVEVKDFPVRRHGTVVAEANLTLDAGLELSSEGELAIELAVEGGRIWLTGKRGNRALSLDPMPEVRFASGSRPEHHVTELPIDFRRLTMRTEKELWIMHRDFSVQVGADFTVHADPDIRMTGAVQLVRGELTLLSNAFRIQEGELRFTGAPPPDPRLDVSAVHDMATGEDLKVQVSGRARAPELVFSGAASTAGEAVAAMTGFGGAGAEGQAQRQASDFAINLLAGLLSMTARRELGDWVPLLSVESDTEGIERLRAGFDASHLIPEFLKGVTRGFYVEGIVGEERGSAGGRPSRALGVGVSAEIAFPHDLVASGSYGPGATWTADLGWAP